MADPPNRSLIPAGLITLATVLLIIFSLRAAQSILIPLTLAALLSFLLAPIASRFEKWHFGRIPSAVLVVLLLLMIVATLGVVVTNQFIDLAEKIPQYRENIIEKAEAVQGRFGGEFGGVTESIKEIGEEITDGEPEGQDTVEAADVPAVPQALPPYDEGEDEPPKPIPVKVVEDRSALNLALRGLGPVIGPLGQAAIVFVLLFFMLLRREDLRDRVLRLMGEGRITITTQALDDAARRVSRYLLMQLVVNTTYGIPVAIGLYFLGVPNALLFGVLAIVLRFIPYVGPWIAASLPIALSLAVFDGWTRPLLVIGLIVTIELISNNVVEPLLYGASTGVTEVALIVAAVFWTWLWGPVGLALATPLTVCLVVLGRYVPQLNFLEVLLTDQPVLEPETRFYQRLLASDAEGAHRIAEETAKDLKLEQVFQLLFVPTLAMAERDHHRGKLSDVQRTFVLRAMRESIEDLAENRPVMEPEDIEAALAETKGEEAAKKDAEPAAATKPTVLCIPARTEADEVAAFMLGQLLEASGYHAEVTDAETLPGEIIERLKNDHSDIVCVSALPPLAEMHARHMLKRLHANAPDLKTIVGVWEQNDAKTASEKVKTSPEDRVVVSLADAVDQIKRMIAQTLILPPKKA
jgi:predicted PurR-regulated permease PerM